MIRDFKINNSNNKNLMRSKFKINNDNLKYNFKKIKIKKALLQKRSLLTFLINLINKFYKQIKFVK